MATYISILRGINVSGRNMIKMDALRDMYTALGFTDVKTYIQSGNVIFRSKKTNAAALGQQIAAALTQTFSVDVPVLVLDEPVLQSVIRKNPFLKDKSKDPAYLHVTFLSAAPDKTLFTKLEEGNYGEDDIALVDNAVYLYCPGGYGNTKLTNKFLETKLKVVATTRNWKTTNELLKMAGE